MSAMPLGPLPNFLGIGAEKAGSTWLDHCLRLHPQCFLPMTKEVNFFNGLGSNLDRSDRFERCGVEWYRGFFRSAGPAHQAVGEITPVYLTDPEAAGRIADTLPDVRLVAILRDPVTRAHSHCRMVRHIRRETANLESYIDADDPRIIGRGRYVRHLRRFKELFGSDQLHILVFEHAIAEPEQQLTTLTDFLGISPHALENAQASARVNAAAGNRSALIYQLGVRIAARLWESPRTIPIAKALKRSGLYSAVKEANRTPPEDLPLSPEIRIRLADLYSEDNQALAEEFGVDTSSWTTRASARERASATNAEFREAAR
jgi:hypothetical protein